MRNGYAEERISYPQPTKIGAWYIYDVPGDGFCGLHALLASFREIKYLENIFYLDQHGWLANNDKLFLQPLVRQVLSLWPDAAGLDLAADLLAAKTTPRYTKNKITNEEITKLVTFVLEGKKPRDLCSDTIETISKMLGLNMRCIELSQLYKKTDDHPEIVHDNNHFRYATKKRIDFTKSWGVYAEQMKNIRKSNAGFDIVNDATVRAMMEGKDKPFEYTSHAANVKIKPTTPKTEATTSPTTTKNDNKATKNKAASFTGLLANFDVQYIVRYDSSSEHLSKFCKIHNLVVDKKEEYCHPFLRTVSNFYLLDSYARILKSGARILDIACKYHHVRKWLSNIQPWKNIGEERPKNNVIDMSG